MPDLEGPPLDIWRGLELLPGHFCYFIFHTGDGKLYFFHLRIGCISTMPCGHFFISPLLPILYSPQNIFSQRTPSPPPQYSNGGSLRSKCHLLSNIICWDFFFFWGGGAVNHFSSDSDPNSNMYKFIGRNN